MSRLLYIQASPRGERSKSITVADAFLAGWRERHPDDEVSILPLFAAPLPRFDGPAIGAKYAVLSGQDFSPEERRLWDDVEAAIDEFKAADIYLLAVPMWNFGIPWKLKQYIDVITQPGYIFGMDDDGNYFGLLEKKTAVVVSARGGDYRKPAVQQFDLQKPYLDMWWAFIGVTDVHYVLVQPTLSGDVEESLDRGRQEVCELLDKF